MQKNLKKSREVFLAERFRNLLQARTLIGRRRDQGGISAAHAGDEKIPEMADSFPAKMLQILSFGEQSMHERQNALCRPRFDRAGQFLENFFGNDAEQFTNLR